MNDLKKAVNAPERLIDGNELMEWLKSKIRECVVLNAHAEAATTEEIIRYVNHMPSVDAVPVVHGRWIYHDDDMMPWVSCSECDISTDSTNKTPYCPNCGARMDGERRNSE